MINLDEYKNILISTYRYEIDNSENEKKNRRVYLDKYYGDEYLSKIITDTYKVIENIFDISQCGYCNIDMDEDTTSYISLNLTGGYFSDRLYVDSYGNIISEYILKRTFGEFLIVEVKEEEHDFETDEPDIMSFDYTYTLYLQGFPKDMQSIKNKLFGNSKVIKKSRCVE